MCSFWNASDYETFETPFKGATMGECRRREPLIIPEPIRDAGDAEVGSECGDLEAARNRTAWPVTLDRDWCGRYRPNEAANREFIRSYRVDKEAAALVSMAIKIHTHEQTVVSPDDWGRNSLARHVDSLAASIPDWMGDIRESAIAGCGDHTDAADIIAEAIKL